jgi:hypothetical protein
MAGIDRILLCGHSGKAERAADDGGWNFIVHLFSFERLIKSAMS